MGRLGQNPSSRGYATPTYATTRLTARETFGGTSKAGLGRHIGMGTFTYSAIVNGSSGHKAPPLAGNSFLAAYRAGYMASPEYPINKTNQLSRVGAGTTGGMTQTPADGVNLEQRKMMQTRVDKWNKVWPAMPIRDTPNNCCKSVPDCKCLNLDLTNLLIIWYDENNRRNSLYFLSVTKKLYWYIYDADRDRLLSPSGRDGDNYTITDQNSIKFTGSDNTSYTFTLATNNDNNIISITKLMTKMGNTTQNIYDVANTFTVPPVYSIAAINGLDGANIARTPLGVDRRAEYDTYDEAENTIIESLDTSYSTRIVNYALFGGTQHICNAKTWFYPGNVIDAQTTHNYSIDVLVPFNEQGAERGPGGFNLLTGRNGHATYFFGGTDENGNIIEYSLQSCT